MIEKFSNKVTKALYSNHLDPVGLVNDNDRSVLTTFLAKEYEELEHELGSDVSRKFANLSLIIVYQLPSHPCSSKSLANYFAHCSGITTLYLRAAGLHLRLSAFFDSPSSKAYYLDLFALWISTTSFLECALNIQTVAGSVLFYSTNYILQMIVAAGFSLLKILNSFFASHIDIEHGRSLFTQTIWAIRSISVMNNDLPSRLAEVLAQLWKSSGAGSRKTVGSTDGTDNSMQLKVKCRMSMSLVFDSVWRWREEFQAQGRGNLECTSTPFNHE